MNSGDVGAQTRALLATARATRGEKLLALLIVMGSLVAFAESAQSNSTGCAVRTALFAGDGAVGAVGSGGDPATRSRGDRLTGLRVAGHHRGCGCR